MAYGNDEMCQCARAMCSNDIPAKYYQKQPLAVLYAPYCRFIARVNAANCEYSYYLIYSGVFNFRFFFFLYNILSIGQTQYQCNNKCYNVTYSFE